MGHETSPVESFEQVRGLSGRNAMERAGGVAIGTVTLRGWTSIENVEDAQVTRQ